MATGSAGAPADPAPNPLADAPPGDGRFFARTGPHGIAAVFAAAGLTSGVESDVVLRGVAPLQIATPSDVSFLDNRKYLPALAATRAGAVLVHPRLAGSVPAGTVAVPVPQPYESWARVAALFHPEPAARPGIHPSAVIAPDAQVDPSAEIGPLAVVGAGAMIGPRCRIAPQAVIGAGVILGADCRIGAHASLSHAVLGRRVYVYPGARIGQEGFGFAVTASGLLTVPQLGRVVIEDDVEIGANSTVDRGSMHDTRIGAGSRLDNLVQIGHNVRLGRCCVIVAQAGISGSTVLEDFVMVAGQAGLNGHIRIGAKARIGARAGVLSDVPAGADVLGNPAIDARAHLREIATVRKLVRAERERVARKEAAAQDGNGADGMSRTGSGGETETD